MFIADKQSFVLVTGGAGYIGSIIVSQLIEKGYPVVVMDNLVQGHRNAVHPDAIFIQADTNNKREVEGVFEQYKIAAVMHMAASTVVSFSMTDPHGYFINNVVGSLNVLDVMLKNKVEKIIFSSSASVYGEPRSSKITEEHETNPINSYGESKLFIEKVLRRYYQAYLMKSVCLRYFCAAGAGKMYGEDHSPETHLVPNVVKAIYTGSEISVFGNDYSTDDGTCVRDFVHVEDIAQAHILALSQLDDIGYGCYNLGNAKGYSVLQVIKAAEEVSGKPALIKFSERRPGDPASLIADATRARNEFGWETHKPDLIDIIGDAWRWYVAHPQGYLI